MKNRDEFQNYCHDVLLCVKVPHIAVKSLNESLHDVFNVCEDFIDEFVAGHAVRLLSSVQLIWMLSR